MPDRVKAQYYKYLITSTISEFIFLSSDFTALLTLKDKLPIVTPKSIENTLLDSNQMSNEWKNLQV